MIRNISSSIFIIMAVFLIGCAATPIKPNEINAFKVDVSLNKASQAATDSLTVMGFNINKQTDFYVEGSRPHKMGLIVGSGGETVGIWLEELGENETKVLIKTAKSFVGIVGQKNWEADIKMEMRKSLGL